MQKMQKTKTSMKEGVDKLKRAWNENPMTVITVGASAVYATAKLIDAVSAAQGRRAYSKQVNASIKRQDQKQKKAS